jgi:glyoxylase-like metal-dependent hydrolase (beta-lactamase superfamily II)
MPPTTIERIRDTCNVWVVSTASATICIDFGSGEVLDHFPVTDVLVTHFHRDNVQGLARAAEAGVRIWVPPVERELFERAGELWREQRFDGDYELRQNRFSLLESVAISGMVDEYRTRSYGGIDVFALPTPGHTVGSVSYLVDVDGRTVAFTGDLLSAPGEVWSLAATQWSYTGVEGQASSILSFGSLARRSPAALYPSHGEPIDDPQAALAETGRKLGELMELRRAEDRPWNLERWLDDPWEPLSEHLLLNRTSFATSYALLSESGSALLIDWGYDHWTGLAPGLDSSASRPMLESTAALPRIEAVVTTHFHDDHVAGINLLRDVHGTEVWAPANVAPILEEPHRYDLPCLWFEPVPVDRVLPLGEPIRWHEYELTAYALPGHTRYAAALAFEVDGRRVLATGDQQSRDANGASILNYQYRNRFAVDDFVASAELYRTLRPDLLLTGHWGAHELTAEQLDRLAADGERVAELHRELQRSGDPDGFVARIVPYRSAAAAGGWVELTVELRNPFEVAAVAEVRLSVPAEPETRSVELSPRGEGEASFRVQVSTTGPLAADVTIGDTRFGQQAEAVVTVT